MFCYQCQEATKGIACTDAKGYCGKTADVSDLQDLLLYTLKGIAFYRSKMNSSDSEIDNFTTENLFATITNANFSHSDFLDRIKKAFSIREKAKRIMIENGKDLSENLPEQATWISHIDSEIEEKASQVGIDDSKNDDIKSLRQLIIYGLKGLAAYAKHASNLGFEDVKIYNFISNALMATIDESLTAEDYIILVNETGKYGVETMAMLDKAHTDRYGHPELTKVKTGVNSNPGILISGHDLKDLEMLLEQTEGTGVDVYTHSEMLPGHYYPAFKKFKHFVGNYGNSWWKQKEEFEEFNGPILFTTNCLVPPRGNAKYKDKVYTTGAVGFDGFKHITPDENGNKDFSEIIEQAKSCSPPNEIENGEIVGGFAHNQVLALADKVVDAVKSGSIKKFVVMAGCDGRHKTRSYYTDFAEALPKDNVILTAGCAKYRYNKLPLGDIDGIPRVLDAGQCNDSYSLALIALKLKEVFGLDDINDLPIVYNIAWYEQKAVIVLLALLYLGVKNIKLGPTLPAFLSPNVAEIIIKNFGLTGISNIEEDIQQLIAS